MQARVDKLRSDGLVLATTQQAEQYLKYTVDMLQKNKTFEERLQGVAIAVHGYEEGLDFFETCEPEKLNKHILPFLTDLRSKMKEAGLFYVSSMSKILGSSFSTACTEFLPHVFTVLCGNNKKLSQIALDTILTVTENVQTLSILDNLLSSLDNPSFSTTSALQAVVESIDIIVHKWNKTVWHKRLEIIQGLLQYLESSETQEIVEKSRALVFLIAGSPEQRDQKKQEVKEVIFTKTERCPSSPVIKKKRSERASMKPIERFDGVIYSPQTAAAFIKYLKKNFETETVDNMGENLMNFIIYSHDFKAEKEMLVKAIHKCGESIQNYALRIIKASGYDEEIVISLLETLGVDRIAQITHTQLSNAPKKAESIFLTIFKYHPDYQPSDDLIPYLMKIAEGNEDLAACLRPKDTEDQILEDIKKQIREGKVFPQSSGILNIEKEKIREILDKELPKALLTQDRRGRQELIRLINTMAPNVGEDMFLASVEPVFMTIIDENDEDYRRYTIECVCGLMKSSNVLVLVLELMKAGTSYRDISLDLLSMYCSEASPKVLYSRRKPIFNRLQPLLDSEDRLRVISIFVTMLSKIPRDFAKQVEKLTPAKTRLILLHAASKGIILRRAE